MPPFSGPEASSAFSVETYRAIFEASPDGVLLVDGSGVIREVNAAAEDIFGYPADELTGQSVDLLVPEAVRDLHASHRSHYMEDPHPRPMGIGMELRGRRKDGSDFPVEISLSPLDFGEGRALVIATVRDVTQRRRLRDFSAGALRASEDERRRIARELHDDTAQRLASLLVQLRLLERADEEDRERLFEELRRQLVEAADSVRQIARALRPPELEDSGVALALRAHARSLQERTGLQVELAIEPVDHLLGRDSQLVLYRIVQEALSNVLRHAGVSSALVQVRSENDLVVALVEDQGLGFEAGRPQTLQGLGVLGMQERATMVGGDVRVESSPGQGTRVLVRIPVAHTEDVQGA
jgi:PAS domain S-box-containing protein